MVPTHAGVDQRPSPIIAVWNPREVSGPVIVRSSTTLANLQASIAECCAQVTHGPLPTVRADSTQLIQLFQNLVGNALKFRGTETQNIHVSAEPKNGKWLFSVRDNGIGIDPEHSDRIFGIFQRLHGRGEYPGTGIGLAICKKIVEGHGGQIWVDSEAGKGATFFFTLPVGQA